MWISREKFEQLCKRVEQLERSRDHDSRFVWHFEVYSEEDHKHFADAAKAGLYQMVQLPRGHCYSVKDVVEKLMAHCGLRLKYTPSSAPNLSLEKSKE